MAILVSKDNAPTFGNGDLFGNANKNLVEKADHKVLWSRIWPQLNMDDIVGFCYLPRSILQRQRRDDYATGCTGINNAIRKAPNGFLIEPL
jgi:hypothetical protein